MNKLLFIAMGGAAGTLSRYWLSGLTQRLLGTAFPYGTFAVNMAGCLLFGAIWGFFENRISLSAEFRFLALTGFLGAFTTFSTYMFESAALLKLGQYTLLFANVIGQTVAGLALVILGTALGRML